MNVGSTVATDKRMHQGRRYSGVHV
jgi:hypothetical protein